MPGAVSRTLLLPPSLVSLPLTPFQYGGSSRTSGGSNRATGRRTVPAAGAVTPAACGFHHPEQFCFAMGTPRCCDQGSHGVCTQCARIRWIEVLGDVQRAEELTPGGGNCSRRVLGSPPCAAVAPAACAPAPAVGAWVGEGCVLRCSSAGGGSTGLHASPPLRRAGGCGARGSDRRGRSCRHGTTSGESPRRGSG